MASDHYVERLIARLPRDWLIIHTKTGLSLAPIHQGKSIAEQLESSGLSHEQSITGANSIAQFMASTNKTIAFIARSTRAAEHPTLLMANQGPAHSDTLFYRLSWEIIKAELQAAGAKVRAPARESVSFSAWTRDMYVMAQDGAILFPRLFETTMPHAAAKNALSASLARELTAHGIVVQRINARFDGGDVLQHPKSNTVFVGVSYPPLTSELTDANELALALGMTLVAVPKTRHIPYYHLDTFMSVLPNGSAILLPDATTPEATRIIVTALGKQELLQLKPTGKEKPIPHYETAKKLTDYLAFRDAEPRILATNLVVVNGNVFTPNAPKEMRDFLEKQGYRTFVGPYQFLDSGPHCLTNTLPRELAPSSLPTSKRQAKGITTSAP